MFITYNIIIIDGKQSLRKGRTERVRLRHSIHLYTDTSYYIHRTQLVFIIV